MKFDDPGLQQYFDSLPSGVQELIDRSGAEISTLGELMLIEGHFDPGPQKPGESRDS